jgi:hypothetical protein
MYVDWMCDYLKPTIDREVSVSVSVSVSVRERVSETNALYAASGWPKCLKA